MSEEPVKETAEWNQLINATALAVFQLDKAGDIRLASDGAAVLLGYDSGFADGQPFDVLFGSKDREAGRPARLLEEARSRRTAEFAARLPDKDGSEVPVEGTVALLNGGGGYTVVLRRSIERFKLQAAADRATAELQQFAFTVSHDLKAPLRSVRSFSELLERRYKGKLDDDATEYIGYIVEGARTMEALLNDVVAYSQAGRPDKTKPQALDTRGVLQWALMNVDSAVKQTQASVTWDEPLASVYADQSQLASVFQHLLSNAMKFRSEAPPVIHVSSRQNGDMVELAVTDNGIGIPPEYHERIFGVFKRLHGKDVPGTGIGLAIFRKIVEAHGGNVSLESDTGKGSTFRFSLPAA